ncbi:MAG TPA: glucosaminidase domain-containing protein [Silvibacterium sp.]|nr:glucosaminidase domain-containing protein [Silvibacterium sp.]
MRLREIFEIADRWFYGWARECAVNEMQSAFLKTVVPAAQISQKLSGIPASITIAQAILESGWGQSALARQANNFFGIKAAAHLAPNQYEEFPTDEFVDGRKRREMAAFAKFATPADSFAAHARLIAGSPRYARAMAACGDRVKFALALQACGYSTLEDSRGNLIYAQRLMQLVDELDLAQYDLSPTPDAPATAQAQKEIAA